MIIIVAKSIIKAGKSEEFKELAKELVTESRKEKGCIAYNLHQDLNDKNIMTFIEEWESKEAIEIHNKSVHFTSIVPKFAEFRDGTSEINLYERI